MSLLTDIVSPYLWALAALTAALGQSVRSVIQKRSRQTLGIYGSAFVRFIFAVPLASLVLFAVIADPMGQYVSFPLGFYFWLVMAGTMQILLTIILGYAFEQRNFATSIALSKTDVLQAAFFEMLLLAVIPDTRSAIAIGIGLLAVFFIAKGRSPSGLSTMPMAPNWGSVALGLGAGFAQAMCAVLYRIALETLDGQDYFANAIMTSVAAIYFQTLALGAFMLIFHRQQLRDSVLSGRVSFAAGTIAAITTFMWLFAFSLKGVAPVRMVGQFEIVFSLMFSVWFFKERVSRADLIGAAAIILSVLILLS
jgi:drug/metabolite transporter (DMT)-like permease